LSVVLLSSLVLLFFPFFFFLLSLSPFVFLVHPFLLLTQAIPKLMPTLLGRLAAVPLLQARCV